MLHALILAPFIAAIIMALASGNDSKAALRLALSLALSIAVIGLCVLCNQGSTEAMHWFTLPASDCTVSYQLRADGLSAWLLQLVTLLTPVALLGAQRQIGKRMREYAVAVFILSGCMTAAFLVTDLVLFYIFFEAMLVPTLVLIALFGDEQRKKVGMQFFIYTMFGSIFFLVSIWYMAVHCQTTDIASLPQALSLLGDEQRWYLFLGCLCAFAVKVPLMPFHSWQAPLYACAPSGAVVLIAGAMAKLGAYGMLRIVLPLFPLEAAQAADCVIMLGGIGVVVGALLAIAQTDLKRMLAFSSLSHLGLVVVGIFSAPELHADNIAYHGAVVQLLGHGFSIAALFVLVGWLERQFGHCQLDRLGGLAEKVPVMAVLFVVASMAAVALPGTAGFAGEFMLLCGIFMNQDASIALVLILGVSIVLGAVYMLRAIQKIFYGPAKDDFNHIQAWYRSEAIAVIPMLICSFIFGFYPAAISNDLTPVQETPAMEAPPIESQSNLNGLSVDDDKILAHSSRGQQVGSMQ